MTIDVLATEAGAAEHLAEFPTEIDEAARTKHLRRRALLLRRFLRNKTAIVGVFMYLFLIVLAIFGVVMFFIALLFLGYVYALRKGVFRWR